MTKSGIRFEIGEVVLVPFPFTDLSQTKRRPVLIISNIAHNLSSDDFVCCGITANLDNKHYSILLEPSEMIDGAIPVTSRIKFDKIFTLKKSLAVKRLGKVNSKKINQVRDALVSLFT